MVSFLKTLANPGLFFVYFQSFDQKHDNFKTNQSENVYLVYGTGIRTHNLMITSLLP